jgi:hypothetical protein
MGLLTLVGAFGMEIEIAAVGTDAGPAVAALSALVDGGFDEGVAVLPPDVAPIRDTASPPKPGDDPNA